MPLFNGYNGYNGYIYNGLTVINFKIEEFQLSEYVLKN